MSRSPDKPDTEKLIGALASNLGDVAVLPHPLKRILPWLGLAMVYLAVVIYSLGVRRDIAVMLHDPYYLFELAMVFSMSVTAAFAALWLCIPDMRGQNWMVVPPLVLFASFLLFTTLKGFLLPFDMPTRLWNYCALECFLYGAVPAFAIFILSVRGKTTHVYLLPFMNVLAVGGFGYVGLRISCASENIWHIGLYHMLPYILFAVLAVMAGRRIYRW